MSRCYWCRRLIWPWQDRSAFFHGRTHTGCVRFCGCVGCFRETAR